jgi:hypothetical protein
MISPLTGSLPTRKTTMEMPQTQSEKISGGPKASAQRAMTGVS